MRTLRRLILAAAATALIALPPAARVAEAGWKTP